MALLLPGLGALLAFARACTVHAFAETPDCTGATNVRQVWPNEPKAFPLIADQPWNHPAGKAESRQWESQFGGVSRIVREQNLPFSPPCALRIDFPVGHPGGYAPGTLEVALGTRRQVYVGMWWKASDPWQGHPSNSNKIAYLFTDGFGSMAMFMYGSPGGPYDLRVYPDWHGDWLTPNVNRTPITLGEWHRLEWLVAYGPTTDPPTGIVRFWMDGELIGDYGNVKLVDKPLAYFKIAPVWGGLEYAKTQHDYYLYDHVHVSGR